VSVQVVTTFLALLALSAAAGCVIVVAAAGAARLTAAGRPPDAPVLRAIAPLALWLAGAVAATATLGSLYFSEVAGFVPCALCWYQRIAMYPLAIVLPIAAARGDLAVRPYATVLAGIGAVIATYHALLQRLPGLPSGACSLEAPCSGIWVERFGVVTIPVMALIGFVSILLLLRIARMAPQETQP
jgi:disulfide bond formation protein DsbB